MSKNISVQEGSIGKQLTVDKLKTNLVGGGSCLWVPEDEINLGTKSVSENGTYVASDDGYYGYSQFTVSGVGTVTGRDPTTGDEKQVSVDPETGDLVETVLPSEIRVITPPTNPYGVYIDGQTITKDGMVVKAYSANEVEIQTVPIGEITINPTQAVYDASKDRKRSGTATSDLIGGTIDIYNGQGVITPTGVSTTFTAIAGLHGVGSTVDAAVRINGAVRCIVASANTPFDYAYVFYEYNEGVERYNDSSRTASGVAYTYNGKTVYYNSISASGAAAYTVDFNASENDSNVEKLAWAMIYGDLEITPAGSPQTITVSWPRTGDGRVLTDTFEILVAPGYGGDEGENGNAGTPPPGMLIP